MVKVVDVSQEIERDLKRVRGLADIVKEFLPKIPGNNVSYHDIKDSMTITVCLDESSTPRMLYGVRNSYDGKYSLKVEHPELFVLAMRIAEAFEKIGGEKEVLVEKQYKP